MVDDLDGWYRDFAAGFRHRYGKLLTTGIPRILRPRKRQGTFRGFTVVDTGGNWLRLSQVGDEKPARATGLAQVIENAARLGDAHGDEVRALAVLTAGLDRHPGAPAIERARAHLYAAELAARTGDLPHAFSVLDDARSTDLSNVDEAEIHEDFVHTEEVVNGLRDRSTDWAC